MGNSGSTVLADGWDVGNMSTAKCEQRLMSAESQTGDFLVRYSKAMDTKCLSIRSGPLKVKHFPIIQHSSTSVSVDEEWAEYAEYRSPIKDFEFESIKDMLEAFVRGGPCAKVAYNHFGCFLLRVSPEPLQKANTTPPAAFAFANFRSQSSSMLTGRSHSSVNFGGKGYTKFTGFGLPDADAPPQRPPRKSDTPEMRSQRAQSLAFPDSSMASTRPTVTYGGGSQIAKKSHSVPSSPTAAPEYSAVNKGGNSLFGLTLKEEDEDDFDAQRIKRARERSASMILQDKKTEEAAPAKSAANEAEDAYHLSGSFKNPNANKATGSYADMEFGKADVDLYDDPALRLSSNRSSRRSRRSSGGKWAGDSDDEEEATGFGDFNEEEEEEEEEATGFGDDFEDD